jgi:hypothetical protein
MDTITRRSRRHGARTFTQIGERPYQRLDGRMTALAIWQSACVECGTMFQVTTTIGTTGKSNSFDVVHCLAHRRRRRANGLRPQPDPIQGQWVADRMKSISRDSPSGRGRHR